MTSLALLLAVSPLAAGGQVAPGAEDICQFPDVDAFLDECPTDDPALPTIREDFIITMNGVPVVFAPSDCVEPVSAMPIAQYTDPLALLQALRTVFYLNGDRCGYLPWTSLSLYDWLRSKVGGFNIDSTATLASCCGTLPSGLPYINLPAYDEANRLYHQTWEGLAESIALVMHEARHVDGFPHVGCCPAGAGACDQTFDVASLSPYGIQYWLERAWLDGTIYTGYACLSPTRSSEIQRRLRSAANGRLDRFCTSPPPALTDANNPAPACDRTCATSASCSWPSWSVGTSLLYLRDDAAGVSSFGSISTSGVVTDRFGVGSQVDALAFAGPDLGYGPNLFYFLKRDAAGRSIFGSISTSGAVTERFDVGSRLDALAFAGPDLGYGPNLFYFLRADGTGLSTFGTLSTTGEVTERFGVGSRLDALAFAEPDLGYGPNLFYFLRRDATGFSTLGTLSTSGAVAYRFGVGSRFDALAFAEPDLGYGPDLLYFLRHDATGFSTFGTISTSGEVADRFGAGSLLTALAAVQQLDVTVTKVGAGFGTVSSSPAGVDCGSTCTTGFGPGTKVTLTALPARGSVFAGWSGACAGTARACAVVTVGPATVVAEFKPSGCGCGSDGGDVWLASAALAWLFWRRGPRRSRAWAPGPAGLTLRRARGP